MAGLLTDDALTEDFYRLGYCKIKGAIPPSVIAEFSTAIANDLASQDPPIDIHSPTTWPQNNKTRVAESAPTGLHPFWPRLLTAPKLAAALDSIVGLDRWELNPNPVEPGVRHWYCPVTFPEQSCAQPSASAISEASSRPALFHNCSTDVALHGPITHPSRWQPVNRRRFLNSGWHIDVGPGFPNAGVRTMAGDERQGPVILVLMSDCPRGYGGTAFVQGSHLPVLSYLRDADVASGGVSHEDLNAEFALRMRCLTETGRVRIECENPGEGMVGVVQACGEAGDVVLLHPLVVHSGTTNCSSDVVRVMANGMARMKGGEGGEVDVVLERSLTYLGSGGGGEALFEECTGEDKKEAALLKAKKEKEKEKEKRERVKRERAVKKREKELRQLS